ncbi:MAG: pirin family protein [Candidatus Zixiibacteriota bacterium]
MINLFKADARHFQDNGWLKTFWLFSFDSYYDPNNIQFGALRVFNDDKVAPGQGFDMHRHREMEIVSIVISGAITHQDSLGNKKRVKAGEVQVMSAGTGIMHSEYNLDQKELHLYQIWFLPNKPGLIPSYDQKDFSKVDGLNKLLAVASGKSDDNDALYINSDTRLNLGHLEKGKSLNHAPAENQKTYIYVSSGKLSVNGNTLKPGDQAKIEEERSLNLTAGETSKFVLIDLF